MSKLKKSISPEETTALLELLQTRFEKHPERHAGIKWQDVATRLVSHPEKLWSLKQMEQSGGEPDVVGIEESSGAFVFYDCAAESPAGRRSFCYDREALDARKANKPANSVMDVATEMGIELLTEEEYRKLQELGNFDTKTSSWIKTPAAIRKLGGALFCDRRYNHVFLYHNGADSYYGARAFRGVIKI